MYVAMAQLHSLSIDLSAAAGLVKNLMASFKENRDKTQEVFYSPRQKTQYYHEMPIGTFPALLLMKWVNSVYDMDKQMALMG